MMSGVPHEICWAFNKLWNNKFHYKAASCWYFYWVNNDCESCVLGERIFSFCSGNLQFFLLFRESPVFPSVQGISSFSFYSGNLQFFLLFRESPVFPRLHSDTNFPGHTAKPSTVSKFVKKTQSQLHTVAAYTGRRYHHLPLQVVVCLVCGNNIDQLLGRWAVEMWGL